MTDVTTYPMIDDFDTTLAQARDGGTWTVYLNEATGITLPASTTTYIVVNPWKSTMQVAKINAVDNSAKTVTVSSISVDKWAWVAYTQQTHPVGSVVRISSNYAFWKDIVDGVNSKVDTNSNDVLIYKYADATARDAGLPSPTNWTQVYLTSEGKWTDYIAWSRQDRDQGTVTANASTTVAGKVEQATAAQNTAGTATGETWAPLFSTPADTATQIQSGTWVYWADAWGDDTYVVALTPTLSAYTTGQSLYAKVTTANTWACSFDFWPWAKNVKTLDGNDPQSWAIRAWMIVHLIYDWTNLILQNEDIASATNKGIVEMATDAEAVTGTDETRYVNPKQAKDNYLMLVNVVTGSRNWSWNESIAHWLSKIPKMVFAYWWSTDYVWDWFYWDWQQWGKRIANYGQGYSASYMIYTSWANNCAVTSIDATNLNVTRTDLWDATSYSLVFIA